MPRSLLFQSLLALPLALTPLAYAQQTPTPETAAWWAGTTALANDAMGGRDTGTDAYQRAAQYVADQFHDAGLQPAGDRGSFFQNVPMHQVDLDTAHSTFEILVEPPPGATAAHSAATAIPLHLLQDLTLAPPPVQVDSTSSLIFLGYGLPLPDPHTLGAKSFQGAAAVIVNAIPAGLSPADTATFAARRSAALAAAGFRTILSIDNPAAIEPFHWPAAYARSVTLAATDAPGREGERNRLKAATQTPLQFRLSPEAAAHLFSADPDHPFPQLLHDAEAGTPLPTLPLHSGIRYHLQTTRKDISSPNILATLPGSDATLAPQFVALSAHLDGYGFGTPVLGDALYNGALDDAAYVALLIELAKQQAALPPSQRPRRSLLFCIFTGEEKGLLGSAYFTTHPTVPIPSIVADLNLDQLRPIFPLTILTMEGLTDSTLGGTARTVASRYGIELRPDREPERNLFRRADNYNFVRVGVPIASFIFGYNPGTPEERTYRDWYARRYHKPQDDLSTPIDWPAAATFNNFFRDLAVAVANAPGRPAWYPTSTYAPAQPRR